MNRLLGLKILISIQLLAISSCGQAIKGLGGIVDNGNKDGAPQVESNSQTSGPENAAHAPILADLKHVSLFGDQHSIEIPSSFLQITIDEKTEAFSSGEAEVLRLSLVSSTCQAESWVVTPKGARLATCGRVNSEYHWVLEAPNGHFVDVKSKLDEAVLESIINTLE